MMDSAAPSRNGIPKLNNELLEVIRASLQTTSPWGQKLPS
jgi:hypothetical protein